MEWLVIVKWCKELNIRGLVLPGTGLDVEKLLNREKRSYRALRRSRTKFSRFNLFYSVSDIHVLLCAPNRYPAAHHQVYIGRENFLIDR